MRRFVSNFYSQRFSTFFLHRLVDNLYYYCAFGSRPRVIRRLVRVLTFSSRVPYSPIPQVTTNTNRSRITRTARARRYREVYARDSPRAASFHWSTYRRDHLHVVTMARSVGHPDACNGSILRDDARFGSSSVHIPMSPRVEVRRRFLRVDYVLFILKYNDSHYSIFFYSFFHVTQSKGSGRTVMFLYQGLFLSSSKGPFVNVLFRSFTNVC